MNLRTKRKWIAAALPLFILWFSPQTMADPFGLSERPINATCIAPNRPVVNTNARVQRAWPNLYFVTVPVVQDFNFRNGPISMAQLPGDNTHWYVVERAGRVHRVINDDSATSFSTVMDIVDKFAGIEYFQQWGINAITFHPDFDNNGWMFVVYNDNPSPGTWVSHVARFTSTDNGLTFDPASEQIVLSYNQVGPFHHFGDLHFGPEGMLYVSSGAAANALAPNLNDLGGKMLRINVDSLPYTIPADNPYANGGGLPEIYASGFRNPFRFNFDYVSGDLWVADVGESSWEEINIVESGGDYGWNTMEGAECVSAGCNTFGLETPEFAYSHKFGVSAIAGVVYRGNLIPELQGTFLFSDYASSAPVWGLAYDANGVAESVPVATYTEILTGISEGNDGEVFVYSIPNFGAPTQAIVMRLLPQEDQPNSGGTFPQTLSATGCVNPLSPQEPAAGLIPYGVNSPLWSDGASKRRWMAIPDGETISLDDDGDLLFPIGTVLVKEFSFNGNPVETRLFVRHDDGLWGGYSYEWEDDLSDATLLPAGKTKMIDADTSWTYPSRQQCNQCHTQIANYSLGLETKQLNGNLTYPGSGIEANQLSTLEHIGMFTDALTDEPQNLPALRAPDDISAPIVDRARSYLHSNCSGCHRPGSAVPALLDFQFETPVGAMQACSAAPLHGDLGVTGAEIISPGNPALSIVSLRMKSLDVHRMPPLGSDVIDTAGTALIDSWISSPDVCSVEIDIDRDGVPGNLDNCLVVANTDQLDADGDDIGNRCDADLNNDCAINFLDLFALSDVFLTNDANADLDGSGIVNFLDFAILADGMFGAPGPSGIANICSK